MVRLKMQNITHQTTPAKNLGDHTRQTFTFHTASGSMVTDEVKIDLLDLRTFGPGITIGRAYLPLYELQKRARDKHDRQRPSSNCVSKHSDVFEIELHLYRLDSFSRFKSRLARRFPHGQPQEVDRCTQSGLQGTDVGTITIQAILHYSDQGQGLRDTDQTDEATNRGNHAAVLATDDSRAAIKPFEQETVVPYRTRSPSSQSVESLASTDSATLGDGNQYQSWGCYSKTDNSTCEMRLTTVSAPVVVQASHRGIPIATMHGFNVQSEPQRPVAITLPISPVWPQPHKSVPCQGSLISPNESGYIHSRLSEPQWRISSWDEWSYVDGFVDDSDQEPAEDILGCLSKGNNNRQRYCVPIKDESVTQTQTLECREEKHWVGVGFETTAQARIMKGP
ncbi:hypothetical protein BG011_005126 [Mortierella polycephala]|uniref:Uncharacterized protein n=1 Tax=Mortierella polycephala TaxID=41804 RepID=A0A9P6U9D0_9FUNG|nr:hypothetical protein BG011_005126 [Mortierella polycephala]